jgi:hypothetical protein
MSTEFDKNPLLRKVEFCRRIEIGAKDFPNGIHWTEDVRIIHSLKKGLPKGAIVVETLLPGEDMGSTFIYDSDKHAPVEARRLHVCPDTLRLLKGKELIKRVHYDGQEGGMWFINVPETEIGKFLDVIKGTMQTTKGGVDEF